MQRNRCRGKPIHKENGISYRTENIKFRVSSLQSFISTVNQAIHGHFELHAVTKTQNIVLYLGSFYVTSRFILRWITTVITYRNALSLNSVGKCRVVQMDNV